MVGATRIHADRVRGRMKTTNEVLAELAEEVEADFAARDTNDGSVYCRHCGAPQPKRPGRRWRHDPSCVVETIRGRIGTWAKTSPKRSNG
jgi:hypothetical protein